MVKQAAQSEKRKIRRFVKNTNLHKMCIKIQKIACNWGPVVYNVKKDGKRGRGAGASDENEKTLYKRRR